MKRVAKARDAMALGLALALVIGASAFCGCIVGLRRHAAASASIEVPA